MRPSSMICLVAALFWLAPARPGQHFVVMDEFGGVVFRTQEESEAKKMAERLVASEHNSGPFYVFPEAVRR